MLELAQEVDDGRYAVSGQPERRLLYAAHINADRDERGLPVVSNGIAMSMLHHSAYDLNLMGIDPDGVVHINRDLPEIHNGPTLHHALQDLDHAAMKSPPEY